MPAKLVFAIYLPWQFFLISGTRNIFVLNSKVIKINPYKEIRIDEWNFGKRSIKNITSF